MKVTVCSPCFYASRKYAEPLLASAKRHHFKVQLYGVGEPFVNYYDAKVLRLREFLHKVKTRYSIYIDCRDVLWLDGTEAVMEQFFAIRNEQKKELVIGTEIVLWPFPTAEFNAFYTTRAKALGERLFRYPAPGMIIGRTDVMLSVLDALVEAKPKMEEEMRGMMKPKLYGDDMALWNWAIPRTKVDAALDYHCQITTVMRPELRTTIEFKHGRAYRKATGTRPIVLHFNCQSRRMRMFEKECRKELWGDA